MKALPEPSDPIDYDPIIPDNQITPPNDVSATATLNQIKVVDVQIANDMLRFAYAGLEKASSVSSLCKLIDTTMGVAERRRKLLCLEYGHSGKSIEGSFNEPLPD